VKIAIGTNIKDGPWGGGNAFARNLSSFLIESGHEVVYSLVDKDIDIILLTEPRKLSETSSFNHKDIDEYLSVINNNSIVFHRINECDQRKGTNYINEYLIKSNSVADVTIFVSRWLENLYIEDGISKKNLHTIMAGANKTFFNPKNFNSWNEKDKLKIVTHHWGTNKNKGYEVYKYIDQLISVEPWKDIIEFTYIGNLPKNYKFDNSNVVEPLYGVELGNELKKNHLYITGSLFEPSGNHHIEAAQCGLPILYIQSGGTSEYCESFGIPYQIENLEEKIKLFMKNSSQYYENMKNYPNDSKVMSKEFLDLFNLYMASKKEIINKRSSKNINIVKKLYLILKLKFRSLFK
tara:strand:+ start:650 stop:1699 length:1050 start_codon:yes stop_codon:yes gene_type:complete